MFKRHRAESAIALGLINEIKSLKFNFYLHLKGNCEIWKCNKDDFIKLLEEFEDIKKEVIEVAYTKELHLKNIQKNPN
jgi:hypothetical protein